MGHGVVTTAENSTPRTRIDADNAAKVATTLQALATPSRLLILARLREGPLPATELAAAVGMEQSACSTSCGCCATSGWWWANAAAARWSTRCTTTTSPNSSTRPPTTSSTCGSGSPTRSSSRADRESTGWSATSSTSSRPCAP